MALEVEIFVDNRPQLDSLARHAPATRQQQPDNTRIFAHVAGMAGQSLFLGRPVTGAENHTRYQNNCPNLVRPQ